MFGVEVSHGTPIYRLVRDGHVEVIPAAIGSADITALAGERIVREMLTGIALRRRSRTS
jgi:hypothetical protein